MRNRSPGPSVCSSPPIQNTARPVRTMPTCSWGWACSSTTACGSRSTTDSIILSAAQVWMRTPGKMVCRLNSPGAGKNRLIAGASAQRENAGKGRVPRRRSAFAPGCRSTHGDAHQVMDLGRLADHERHGDRVEGDGAQAALVVDGPALRLNDLGDQGG